LANDPISQFQITEYFSLGSIGGVDFAMTNSAAFMIATTVATCAFLIFSTSSRGLIPTRMQSIAEICYDFVASTLRDAAGKEGMRFFPLVFSLFMFVLVANLFGMFPYFFTVTSHLIVTFALAMLVILTVVGYGFMKHGFGFLKLFVVRLFANMLAGHITLKVFAGFITSLSAFGVAGMAGAVLPFAMTVALTGLEFLVAFLQAYVFTVLTCMYLNDAVHPSH